MNKELFEKYANLEAQKRAIENEQAGLRGILLSEMLAEAPNGVTLPGVGQYSVVKRRTWTYSSVVELLVAGVDKQKKEEQQKGVATAEISETMMFVPLKKEGTTKVPMAP